MVMWPESLRPALTTVGFATELRDLMSRCGERGVDRPQLERIGRLNGHPEWVAAGRFAQQYEQVMLLRAAAGMAAPQATMPALSAAELVGVALETLATDPQLPSAEHRRIQVLLVDDAQHLDPQAARLVTVLAAGAQLTVVAGDYQQTVFGFRGADPRLLDGDAEHTVALTRSHRCAPAVARVVSGVAARLPGATAARRIEGADGPTGSVAVRLAATPRAEAAIIADALRRAHLVDGVPWAEMAVIVRSRSQAGVLTRALTAAGVPVGSAALSSPPADHPAVYALLTTLGGQHHGFDRRAGAEPVDRAHRTARSRRVATTAQINASSRRWGICANLWRAAGRRRHRRHRTRCPARTSGRRAPGAWRTGGRHGVGWARSALRVVGGVESFWAATSLARLAGQRWSGGCSSRPRSGCRHSIVRHRRRLRVTNSRGNRRRIG